MVAKRCLAISNRSPERAPLPGKSFPNPQRFAAFLEKIPDLAALFKSSGSPVNVIWIRADYDNDNTDEGRRRRGENHFRTGTHTGKTPCCKKGSPGASFPNSIQVLVDNAEPSADNIVIIKTWVSAFKETSLLTELRNRGTTELFVCGLLTNVCVSATVVDAFDLGFEITLVKDSPGWRKRSSHDRALDAMLERGA